MCIKSNKEYSKIAQIVQIVNVQTKLALFKDKKTLIQEIFHNRQKIHHKIITRSPIKNKYAKNKKARMKIIMKYLIIKISKIKSYKLIPLLK